MAQPRYEELGTLSAGPELTAQVVRRPGGKELYLLNRVPMGPDTRGLFRDLYFYHVSRPERSELVELFSDGQKFCVLFRYHQGPSLRERFKKRHGPTAWRLTVLADVLFHVYSATRGMPLPVVCGMLRPDNILFDENELVSLRWRLEPELWKDGAVCGLWGQVGELMRFLVGKEAESPHYRTLNSIYKKCRAGLYPSLPAMIHDLRRAGEPLDRAGPFFRLTAFFYAKKAWLLQAFRLGAAAALICLIAYAAVEVRNRREAETAAPITKIGNITYASAQEAGQDLRAVDPVRSGLEEDHPVFVSLPGPEAELDSEDYVVQPGDTLGSICAAVYGSEWYGGLVASFNGLGDGPVEAGMVLRLPRRDQLAQYWKD